MKKKTYQKPCSDIIRLAACQLICESPLKTTVAGENETPTGGWGPANVRRHNTNRNEMWGAAEN